MAKTKRSPTILNLGAGQRQMDDALNVDWKAQKGIDFVCDLNDLPWPWEDESFETIAAFAIFEHLRVNLIQSMDECWRILRPGGKVVVKIPHWHHNASYIDPTHYWRFALESMHVFDPSTKFGARYSYYTDRHWRIVKGPRLSRCRSSIWTTLQPLKGEQ